MSCIVCIDCICSGGTDLQTLANRVILTRGAKQEKPDLTQALGIPACTVRAA